MKIMRATPSAEVWQKIEAGMDKYDAGKYKKRFVGWRITAILLFLPVDFFYGINILHPN